MIYDPDLPRPPANFVYLGEWKPQDTGYAVWQQTDAPGFVILAMYEMPPWTQDLDPDLVLPLASVYESPYFTDAEYLPETSPTDFGFAEAPAKDDTDGTPA